MPDIECSEPYAGLTHLSVAHGATSYLRDMTGKPPENAMWMACPAGSAR